MRLVIAVIAAGLCASACERASDTSPPAAQGASGASIKATQAMALIDSEVEPMIWDSAIEGGRDRGTLEVELHSLEGPWRWESRQRRLMSQDGVWYGISADLTFSVSPEAVQVPVEVVQGADDRWDVLVSCREGPCFRYSGSMAQPQGGLGEVEAALDTPTPVDDMIDSVFFPFRTQAQAERVAAAMNELLALQGATGA